MTKFAVGTVVAMTALAGCSTSGDLVDPLASWNDGATKQSIVEFVESVTNVASPAFVDPAERIAVTCPHERYHKLS